MLNAYWIMITFFILGPLMLIFGGAGFIRNNQITSKCTAEASGMVIKVEEIATQKRGTITITYVATVAPINKSIFSSSELTSLKTDYKYTEGDYVMISYDPSDPSNYYIQHAKPTGGDLALIFVGAIVTVIALGIFVVKKIEKAGENS